MLGSIWRSRFAPLAGGVLIGLACSGLGSWQSARLVEKREWIEAMSVRMHGPPGELGAALMHPEGADFRRVRVAGELDLGESVFVPAPGRIDEATGHLASGMRAITPLAVDGHPIELLVDRGVVALSEIEAFAALQVGARRVELEGVLQPLRTRRIDAPVERRRRWHRVDVEGLARQMDRALEPWLLVLAQPETPTAAAGDPAPTPRLAPPASSVNHLHYAITWYSIGAVALLSGLAATTHRTRRNHLSSVP